jgi:hypothetical protein
VGTRPDRSLIRGGVTVLGTVLPFTVENPRVGSGPVVTTSKMEGAAYAKGTEAAGDRVAATPAT